MSATEEQPQSPRKRPKPPRGRGRPSLIDDQERLDRLFLAISLGLRADEALKYAGIGKSTFYAWKSRGRDARDLQGMGIVARPGEVPYIEFLDRLEREDATFHVQNLAVMNRAARSGSWRAAAWLLEHLRPDDYSATPRRAPEATSRNDPEPVSLEELEAAVREVKDLREKGLHKRGKDH
jgi:hypothetical protein